MITWIFSREESQVLIKEFLIEYRTVGPWVRLSTVPAEKTWHLWDTVSRGATYHFRVFALSDKTQSLSSNAVMFFTGGEIQMLHTATILE